MRSRLGRAAWRQPGPAAEMTTTAAAASAARRSIATAQPGEKALLQPERGGVAAAAADPPPRFGAEVLRVPALQVAHQPQGLPVAPGPPEIREALAAAVDAEHAEALVDEGERCVPAQLQPEVPVGELVQPGIETPGRERGLAPHEHERRLADDVG